MKKIAIDSYTIKNADSVRGIGVQTRELMRALDEIDTGDKRIEYVNFKDSDLSKYDLVHYQKFNPYVFSLPFIKSAKTLVTIHDVIYLQFKNKYPAGIRGNIKLSLQKIILKSVDGVITISDTSKVNIAKFLHIPKRKIHVVHLAPPEIFKSAISDNFLAGVKNKYKLPDKFVLYCGDINYNKNIPGLVAACKLAKTPLVIVGKNAKNIESTIGELENMKGPRDWIRFLFNIPHPELSHNKDLISAFRNSEVIRLGYLAYEEYFAVMKSAFVYCQLSFQEGFGITLLEAMAAGTPVVASDISVFHETCGNAAIFVDPNSPQEAAKNIKKLAIDIRLAKEYSTKGKLQADKFSWNKTARETLMVYEKILGRF